MIIVVITVIVIVLYKMDKRYKEDTKRIKELEQRLMKHEKDQTNANRTIENGRERLKTIREYRGFLIEAGLKQ